MRKKWEELSDKEQSQVIDWFHVCRRLINPKDPLYRIVSIGIDYIDESRNKFHEDS